MLELHPEVRILIAGRCADETVLHAVSALEIDHPGRVEYQGERYGEEKRRFLASLDLLLFPTEYPAECEPIVLLESLSVGTAFVATDLACIPDIAAHGGGWSVPRDEFTQTVERLLRDRATSPSRTRVRASFESLLSVSQSQLNTVLDFTLN